eukprot:CAMPEP_0194039606 /NCGR_PEP_ID=MMETSP0009_2-20130614/11718_1 /TAXON_ID=210454 /ORGANISM="Grammatophora oceanica, Strain CCMP 410" /LENGTH=508 /DNA_ID=CAMNT_0038682501 /DNA_START=9 /DNA_END=1538 /DNA_ORIENTATION=-
MATNNAAPPAVSEAKRQAMTGQWRTPPLPTFGTFQATSTTQQATLAPAGQMMAPPQQTMVQAQSVAPPPTAPTVATAVPTVEMAVPSSRMEDVKLPESTDDYAKALQEAYRRGAEAAARLQQQQMQTAVSCPNLQQFTPQQPPVAHVQIQPQPPQPPQQQQQLHQQPAPAPPQPQPQPQPIAAQPPPPQAHGEPTMVTANVVPNPLSGAPTGATRFAAPPSVAPPHPQHAVKVPAPGTIVATSMPASAARSVSLPDMQSYAARAQAEEEKRKKRLARNRASARLRRLRKKNLVDSYEGEVGVLEASLQKLKAHSWGSQNNHEALLEALSMERGQQEISPEQRIQLIQDILQQQLQQAEFLREAQMEQQMLKEIVENPEDELSRELQQILQLSPQQQQDVAQATQGLDEEVEAMNTFIECLQAMQNTNWLDNDGVTAITQQFTSILHANQVSKFLLWADANAESLDQLEYCQAPPSQAPPANAPVFVFGMDDHHGPAPAPSGTAEVGHN